ncbi:Gmad2 immunoglobulin-like domain-containing protein [Paenibacillus tarimensis]
MKGWKGFVAGLAAGSMLMLAIPSFAATVKQYLLVKSGYPIVVNGSVYNSPDLPVLNYEGNTYIPMRAVGQILGASVMWNKELKRAEIRYGSGDQQQNSAFRNIKVSGSNGTYTVTGEARVFEAVMHYAVSDGHDYLFEKMHVLNEGAPEWSAFTLEIKLTKEQMPANGTLMLEVFEYSAKDGSKTNEIAVPLEQFGS